MNRPKDISLMKTVYWAIMCKTYDLSLLIYPNVHFRIGNEIKICNKGSLKLGCRWGKLTRFKPSDMKIANHATLEVNGHFSIYTGFSIQLNTNATLKLGSGFINEGLNLHCWEKMTFGEDVGIGKNVTLMDSDQHKINPLKKISAPIVIGNHVWIGTNATILKGVTIGDGAVVAACALVNKDVPPNTLVAGVPAKVVKTDIQFEW